MLLSHGALNQVHDLKVLSSRHLKTWAQDSYCTSQEKNFSVASSLMEGPPTGTLDRGKSKHLPLLGPLLSLTSSNRVTKKVVHLNQARDCSMLTSTRSRNQALCTSFLQRARVGHTCEVLPVLQKAQSCSDTAALTNSHHAECGGFAVKESLCRI